MTQFHETIHIKVTGQDSISKASNRLYTLQKRIERLNKAIPALGRNFENAAKVAASSSKTMMDSFRSMNTTKTKRVTQDLKNLSTAMKDIKASSKSLNISKSIGNSSQIKSVTTQMDKLSKSTANLKKNGRIRLRITSNANQVLGQLGRMSGTRTVNVRYTQSGGYIPRGSVGGAYYGGYSGMGISRGSYGTRGGGSRFTPNIYGFHAGSDISYQAGKPIKNIGMGFSQMSEKIANVSGNLMIAGSYLGARDMAETIISTPAKAEVQRYLLNNMQGDSTIKDEETGEVSSLYNTLDKTTDQLPISMQNVVQPLYAFKAASGATAQEMNNIIPEFANFGAQVINMTGSEEQAEEAMQKLSRAYQGQYAAVDQYGITKEALERVGYKEGGSIEEFMKAVTEITGNAKDSMNNFNGMKALVGKDFSRAGKDLWNSGVGQTLTMLVSGFHELDSSFAGIPSKALVVGATLIEVTTVFTSIFGSLGVVVGNFATMAGSLKAIRENGGGLKSILSMLVGSARDMRGFDPRFGAYSYGSRYGISSTQSSGDYSPYIMYGGGSGSSRGRKRRRRRFGRRRKRRPKTGSIEDILDMQRGTINDGITDKNDRYVFNRATGRVMQERSKSRKSFTDMIREEGVTKRPKRERFNSWLDKATAGFKRSANGTRSISKGFSTFTKALTKSASSLFDIVSPVTLAAIALSGLGLAFTYIHSKSKRVQEATSEITSALQDAGTAFIAWISRLISGKVDASDTEALIDAVGMFASSLHDLAYFIREITGTDKYSQELNKMSDEEKYGWQDTDSEAVKQQKQQAVDTEMFMQRAPYFTSAGQMNALGTWLGGILGIVDAKSETERQEQDYKNKIQAIQEGNSFALAGGSLTNMGYLGAGFPVMGRIFTEIGGSQSSNAQAREQILRGESLDSAYPSPSESVNSTNNVTNNFNFDIDKIDDTARINGIIQEIINIFTFNNETHGRNTETNRNFTMRNGTIGGSAYY